MAAGIQVAALALSGLAAAALLPAAAPMPASSLLAGYSFEEEDLATGPDTFSVFRKGQGDVRLAEHFRVSGYRSVEIRDAARDGEFPELQGYFPVQTRGRLRAHFAFLTTDTAQTLNVALAGPAHFRLRKDGIAFWLAVREGMLFHTSDSIPKRLKPVQPFVWYVVDVDYDIDGGHYSLRVQEEGAAAPLVSLIGQPNATKQAGSSVDKFSFVGDVENDATHVTYYVDDVLIGSSVPSRRGPFVAPGRRKLFVDAFQEYRRIEAERLQCLPVTGPEDLGLDTATVRELSAAGLLQALHAALAGARVDQTTQVPVHLAPHLSAASWWGAGCNALGRRRHEEALAAFERAATASPGARVYALSAVLALVGLQRFDDAQAGLDRISGAFRDDPRPWVVAGVLGLARGDAGRARAWLQLPAEQGGTDTVARMALDLYYYALLADNDHRSAAELATRWAQLTPVPAESALWLERRGDAEYYAGARDAAREAYRAAGRSDAGRTSVWLKLSDLAFLDGDLAAERRLREKIYGSLN